jgi:acetyl-CoA C-acetyltransferase
VLPENSPVLVGVGQVRGNRDRTVAGAREPLRLLADAVHAAAADAAGTRMLRELDAISLTHTASWSYADLPRLLADRVAAEPARLEAVPVGGHQPAAQLDAAAARIAAGETRIELVAGAEAAASTAVLARAGVDPGIDLGWTTDPGGPAPIGPDDLGSPAMLAAGIALPRRFYPMVDTALGHALGETPAETMAAGAEVFAALSAVAAGNEYAWNPLARSASEIAAVGPENRMICEPYPLAMNAMPLVDQAAALLLTSVGVAREQGVPEERMVHVWGGAGAVDATDVLARADLAGSPALCSTFDRALAAAGLAADEIDVVDLYSCFPVVPRLAARYLGLPLSATAGATGGHSAFGGPLSSYTLHSVAACARRIRAGARTALVHANGGYLTREHAVVLAGSAHVDGYVGDPVPHDVSEPGPRLVAASGEVTVEAATVEYDRDGNPAQAYLVALTEEGDRVAGCTAEGDAASAHALSLFPDGPTAAPGDAVVGRRVRVSWVGERIQVDPAQRARQYPVA